MLVDNNPTQLEALKAFQSGDRTKGVQLQDEFIAQVHEFMKTNDHCTCPNPRCKHHGNCLECVSVHRGHRDHLPHCLISMVNERLLKLSALTEHTIVSEIKK